MRGPKFATWRPEGTTVFWIMTPEETLDSSLDAIDRMRYYVFELLREKGEVTEGAVRQHLLTRLSKEHDLEPIFSDMTAMPRSVAQEITPHVWRFDSKKITEYKQLRLLFKPSRAEKIREWFENREVEGDRRPLRVFGV